MYMFVPLGGPRSYFGLETSARIVPASCKRREQSGVVQMSNSLLAARQEVARILARDLARQYESPLSIDFSVYDENVTFDDPTTKLKGKLMYKGMILTIGLVIVPYLFKRDTVFELNDCELTEDGKRVRTTFVTKGTTRWGSPVVISGEDFFWFGERSSQIIRHQSTWDQTEEEVMRAIRGRLLT
eukprot:GFKZ01007180.1.p1 GENE.GFKZ01007180.1~~GFKZ01007180.1.p1  ORF type:complete len:185 (-),score=13.98 GFKZ01007180.1:696-1250(-)